jgi:hypothetical protein
MGKRGGKQTLKKVCALNKLKAFAQSNSPADLGKKLCYFGRPNRKRGYLTIFTEKTPPPLVGF